MASIKAKLHFTKLYVEQQINYNASHNWNSLWWPIYRSYYSVYASFDRRLVFFTSLPTRLLINADNLTTIPELCCTECSMLPRSTAFHSLRKSVTAYLAVDLNGIQHYIILQHIGDRYKCTSVVRTSPITTNSTSQYSITSDSAIDAAGCRGAAPLGSSHIDSESTASRPLYSSPKVTNPHPAACSGWSSGSAAQPKSLCWLHQRDRFQYNRSTNKCGKWMPDVACKARLACSGTNACRYRWCRQRRPNINRGKLRRNVQSKDIEHVECFW